MDTYVYIHSIYWIGKADKENGLEKLGKNSNFALWRVQFLAKIALLKVQFKGNFITYPYRNKRFNAQKAVLIEIPLFESSGDVIFPESPQTD